MKQKKAFRLLVKLESLRGKKRELYELMKIASSGELPTAACMDLAGEITAIEERLRQNGYDPRRTDDIDD